HLPALDAEVVGDVVHADQLREEVALLELLQQQGPRLRRQLSQIGDQLHLAAVPIQERDEVVRVGERKGAHWADGDFLAAVRRLQLQDAERIPVQVVRRDHNTISTSGSVSGSAGRVNSV